LKAKDLRIVFMGTPEIAAHTLGCLVESNYNLVGVITAPDKPAGRGRKIAASPVKKYALQVQIPVLQPENLKSEEFLEQLKAFKPDIQVVVAFRMLPEKVWSLPLLGTFNLHASLLPQYRGAAPINWAVINGEPFSGITTFMLDKDIDTGQILFQEKIPLDQYETAGSLHDKIMHQGSALVIKTIDALAEGNVRPIDQQELQNTEAELKKAPKIYKDHCRINWNQSCNTIANFIHGLSPAPGAFYEFTFADGQGFSIKFLEVRPQKINHNFENGTLISDNKNYLGVCCADGIIWVKSLQMSGKRPMDTEELLRGYKFSHVKPWPENPTSSL
jgi:methionyl-tRNA formyltransferase